MSDGGFAPAGATRGLCARPLDPFAVHTPMLWGFIFLCYMEHLTRTAGSPDKHADTVCSRHQLNRAEGSREKLPCGVKGQRPLGSPNQHAGTLCSCAQPNREKGVERVEDPLAGSRGSAPLGSPNQHAGTLCSCAQPNRAKGSREELPCTRKIHTFLANPPNLSRNFG